MAVQPETFSASMLAPLPVRAAVPGRILAGPWPDRVIETPASRFGPGQLGLVLATWLQTWGYASTAGLTSRDLRIDLVRGFCVFAMLADHVGGDSWLYAITGGNRSFVSAAEGFIFISGLVMGQVYASKIQRLGLIQAILQAMRRARTLYVLTVVMTLIFCALRLYTDVALWVPHSVSPGADSLPELVVGAMTLHFTYHGTDILAMYVFCVLAAVVALVALAFHQWRWVLGVSWLAWLAYQFYPQSHVPWYIRNSENFPLAAWQVLFITGLVVGFRGRALTDCLARRPGLRLGLVGLAAVATVVVAIAFVTAGDIAPDAFDKVSQRPLRLAGFAAVATLVYAAVTLFWQPLLRATGWLLLPLGQHALYCYALHLFVIVLLMNGLPTQLIAAAEWLSPVVWGTALQLGLVMVLWVMVRRRILFGVVPN